MSTIRVTFLGVPDGAWAVDRITTMRGAPLPSVAHLERLEGVDFCSHPEATWSLHGVRSHDRYVERAEKDRLAAIQPDLDRAESLCAALIPIRKSEAWWSLTQDERRAIFESRSHHIAIGLDHLPAIARRLYHCRDLGGPFDFLTWFEFAEADAASFDRLLDRLRATAEWEYVDREVELRLRRRGQTAGHQRAT